MSISETINFEYRNIGNLQNPILEEALSMLEDTGMLKYMEKARSPEQPENSIKMFKNLDGDESSAAPLEIITDILTRIILKSYKEGFDQGLHSDGSTNIGFELQPTEIPILLKVNLNSSKNVHEAIVTLAQEINQIKLGLVGLGVDIPNSPTIPTFPINVK